jgi:hypothetical protein
MPAKRFDCLEGIVAFPAPEEKAVSWMVGVREGYADQFDQIVPVHCSS